ncbi:dol-P-Glc:Glc(2)Man(9)GlcNAc(2)-PP-Dol alpha-1,2-glucosyltransferase isoform X9 [Erinaceus europaeus]|uniref:Dol-P-Glc:Glc(2)Man(9)GlcNAc(2)-PP-Dol alpha-1,2-glucosyltransferase n=1 Tax=Erinaceus europaeus TaxID=9365 RepID=A0ABM3XP89_ERIEU|nr:dol-P-Glc:Glc(2)Man(9)GlcNAc(2)-PP-Dol alpha-1,2-glucosyltransferase isoform X9 [Erinaceus europaeus]
MEGHLFSAALSGSFLASCLLFAAVGRALREPYMDEVFHLPQAQRFCQGHFTEWDPMITTLPGLYLLSVGVVKPAGWLLGWPEQVVCSIGALRFVNLLFSAGNFYLLHLLLCRTQPRHKPPGSRCYHDAKQTSLDRRPTNVSWSPASPEPCPTRERERQAGSMDQPVNVHVQRGSNFRSQTFHILHPTMTLGLYSQRVKE